MKLSSEQSMLDFGARFAQDFLKGEDSERSVILELIGDVGTGKTTFTRGLARGLGFKEPITSPSFTISKAYALPDGRTLVHYDFYRLGDPGLMVDDLTENLKNPQNIIVIEWGESVKNFLPEEHYVLNFSYNDDGSHEVIVSGSDFDTEVATPSQDASSDADNERGFLE